MKYSDVFKAYKLTNISITGKSMSGTRVYLTSSLAEWSYTSLL